MSSNRWFLFVLAACGPGSPASEETRPSESHAASRELSIEASGALFARNREHALRARFEPYGVVVTGGAGAAEADIHLSLRAWGREGALEPAEWMAPEEGDCVSDALLDEATKCPKRMHYVRDGLVEWWETRSEGLEHGFTVMSPPPGDGLLVFEVAIEGAQVTVEAGDGTAATLSRLGAQRLSYDHLAAWDDSGRTLPAWMEETDVGLRLVVDDSDAVGAVTVDPLLTEAWTAEPDHDNASFGQSVSSAGDVNGDGYGDVVVGAYSESNGQQYEGRAYLYLGSAVGLESTAAWTAESDQVDALLGYSVSSAGDVNDDGYGDVVVGAFSYDTGLVQGGKAYLYLGSAAGLETTAAWTAESDQDLAFFGNSVSAAGDVNGDGFGDVVVGAPYYDNPEAHEGTAYLYLGTAAGLATTAAWTGESNQVGALFGASVSSAGDVNGDGYADVVVGAYESSNGEYSEGKAYLYLGSAAGLDTTASWTAESNQSFAHFGISVSSAGDVNGDGYDDLVVGGGYENGEIAEGGASLYLGSAAGLETTAAWTADADQAYANFGISVSSAGDVNGDGYDDVVVGASGYENGEIAEGGAFLYLGSAAGLETTAAWTTESDIYDPEFGSSVSSAGDVNGDGHGDVVVGAPDYPDYDGEPYERGRAYLYVGSCDADDDSDGVCGGDDCDDTDATVFPGAPELCDGVDNACAGFLPADELDADLDGVLVCAGDCDDDDPTAYPGAPELCGDELDNDCDGVVDQVCVDVCGGCDGTSRTRSGPLAVLLALAAAMMVRRSGDRPHASGRAS